MNVFHNFNAWHKVPEDAMILSGTPYWRYFSGEGEGRYYERGEDDDLDPSERFPHADYYTEEPLLSPSQVMVENRARNMYYMVSGLGWEYEVAGVRDNWLNLATKYVEK